MKNINATCYAFFFYWVENIDEGIPTLFYFHSDLYTRTESFLQVFLRVRKCKSEGLNFHCSVILFCTINDPVGIVIILAITSDVFIVYPLLSS